MHSQCSGKKNPDISSLIITGLPTGATYFDRKKSLRFILSHLISSTNWSMEWRGNTVNRFMALSHTHTVSNRTTDNKQGQTCILVFSCQRSVDLDTEPDITATACATFHVSFVYRHDTKTPKKQSINYQQFWAIFGQPSWEKLQGWSKISSSKEKRIATREVQLRWRRKGFSV